MGEFLLGWEKKVKVVKPLALIKKGCMSRTTKPKFAKKGDDSFETCSDTVLYKEGLPPIGDTVLVSSPPPAARTRFTRCSTAARSRPPTLKPSMDAPPFSKTHGSERKTTPLVSSTTTKRRACYLKILLLYFSYLLGFLATNFVLMFSLHLVV